MALWCGCCGAFPWRARHRRPLREHHRLLHISACFAAVALLWRACRGALPRRAVALCRGVLWLRCDCLLHCAPPIVHPAPYRTPRPLSYALPRLLTLSALLCLPRLQLECRRRPIPCNRGRRNAPFGQNTCRVCNWNAAEGRFYAIAAGETPLLARMLAAFAAGTLQNADFMQSRPEKRPFPPECLPRLQLECRRTPIPCNRGRENAPFGRNTCRVCS